MTHKLTLSMSARSPITTVFRNIPMQQSTRLIIAAPACREMNKNINHKVDKSLIKKSFDE